MQQVPATSSVREVKEVFCLVGIAGEVVPLCDFA